MRTYLLAAAAVVLAAGPVIAQPDAPTPTKHAAHAKAARHGPEAPLDKGPDTPEANRAYQGGGVVLEGQSGGPPPIPEPTPPGQTPRGAVSR